MVPKIVIDTNIYISAIFWGGKPRAVVDLGRSEQVLIFTSSEIEKEIEKKLKTKFGISDEEAAQILLDGQRTERQRSEDGKTEVRDRRSDVRKRQRTDVRRQRSEVRRGKEKF